MQGCHVGNTRPENFYILLDPRTSVYIDWFHLEVEGLDYKLFKGGKFH